MAGAFDGTAAACDAPNWAAKNMIPKKIAIIAPMIAAVLICALMSRPALWIGILVARRLAACGD
jgi:hypothetical protein